MQINSYLTFPGNCADAVAFYKEALGATVEMIHHFRGSPMAETLPPEALDKVMHVTMKIGGSILMASDAVGPYEGVKGVSLSINVDDVAQGERVFVALAAGGQVTMPFADQFWGARFGMLVDKFGVPWQVNCELPRK